MDPFGQLSDFRYTADPARLKEPGKRFFRRQRKKEINRHGDAFVSGEVGSWNVPRDKVRRFAYKLPRGAAERSASPSAILSRA